MYLLILLVGLTLASEDEQQYCGGRYTHLCLGKGQHVACQFPVAGSGPNCQNYSRIRFTAELRNVITNFINKRRQRIAAGHERVRGGKHIPTPQVMMFVEWDVELARLAQRLADQCYFVHDECRATVRYPYAGQSVGEVRWRHLSDNYELSAQRAIRRVFDAWWGERRRVEPHQLVKPFKISNKGLVWGHFSQLAVWSLRAVGCGAVRHGEDYPRLLLVCNFSHTNMLGEKTIVPGEVGPCPEHTRRKARSNFPLLCASVKEQIKNSRVVEEEVLDESDYDDEEGNSEVLQENLKKLGAVVTGKPKRYREDEWGNNRLKPTEETDIEETATAKKWTTGAYLDEHEIISDDDADYITPLKQATKAPHRKLRVKIKPITITTPETSGRKIIIDEEEYRSLAEKSERINP
ncbi:venom allergen 3-like [Cydia strobilella]|uniref:venom allergen 3-like n=1 Tax=Cydia strobilella TaxID=1100964 RepID=UPI00300705D9